MGVVKGVAIYGTHYDATCYGHPVKSFFLSVEEQNMCLKYKFPKLLKIYRKNLLFMPVAL